MDVSYIKEIIEKCLIDVNLDITKLLSFDSRIYILNNTGYFFDNYFLYNTIKFRLFTKSESEKMYKSGNHQIEFVYHLSDNFKLELIDQFYSSDLKALFLSIESDEKRKDGLIKILNKNNYIDSEYLLSFKNVMHGIDTIDEFLSVNDGRANSLLNYQLEVPKNIGNFDELIQHKILDLYDKYNCFQYGFFDYIDDNLSIFLYIIKFSSVKKNSFNLSNYIENLRSKGNIDINYVYDMLVSYGYELKYQDLASLFFISSEEKKRDFIDHIYKDAKNLNYLLNSLVYKYPKEQIPQKLYELFFDDERFDAFGVAFGFKNALLFNCLDVIIRGVKQSDKYDYDKKRDLCKNLLDAFSNLSYDIAFSNDSVSCENLIGFFCEQLNLNRTNFEKLIFRFGYQVFKYMKQEKIQKFINFDEKKLDMVMNIFNEENIVIDGHKMDSLIEAVIQREFIFKQSDVYNIFSRFESLIGKKANFKIIYEEVISKLAETKLSALQKICLDNNTTLDHLFIDLCNNDSRAIGILHSITNLYISICREEYTKKRTVEIKDELDLCKRYQKEWIQRKYIEIKSNYDIYLDIRCLNSDELTDEQRILYDDREQLEAIIAFKKNPNDLEIRDKFDRKNLKIFTELFNILYEKDKLKDTTNDSNAKYIYSFNPVKRESLLEVLSALDFDSISEKLLSNIDAYNTLLDVFTKYKYLGMGSTFYSIRDNIDLDIGCQSIAGLINYFYVLYNDFCEKVSVDGVLKRKLSNGSTMSELFISDSSMTKLLEEGFVHEMASSKYSFLLGDEDFRLIFANVGKNRASATADARLSKVIELIPKMYDRSKISVPSINDVITLDNGKKIDVIIGSADFMNLTVGERTKACLRACGAFRDLWEFCLTDKNGFNIIYLDHDTGKFISRVSAVRNGNTVFENELRESVCVGFSNDDVVSINNIVSNMLVSLTKDSDYPIDNVLITSDYAMKPYESQKQAINTDRKRALYDLSFNYGSGDYFNAVVLSNDGVMMPIVLGPDDCSLYDTCVGNISLYSGVDIMKKVKQLHAINDLLSGVSVEDMNIIDVSYDLCDLVCIANNQFYVIKHGDEVIDSFILDKCKDNETVVCEFERAKGGFTDEKNRSNRQL